MFFVHHGSILRINATSASAIVLAERIVQSNDYDFVVFDTGSKDFPLYGKCDKNKRRLLYSYGENADYPYSDGSWTTVRSPHISVIKNASLLPTIHLSGIGLPAYSSLAWKNNKEEEAAQIVNDLLHNRCLLFYGRIDGRRQRQFSFLTSKGWKIVNVHFNIKENSLLEIMKKNNCCMAIGADGDSIGCYRDYEISLSSVACIRICESKKAHFAADPTGGYYCLFEDSYIDPIDSIRQDVQSGELIKRIKNAYTVAEYTCRYIDEIRTLDAVSHDHDFTRTMIANSSMDDLSVPDMTCNWISNYNPGLLSKYAIKKESIQDCDFVYLSALREKTFYVGYGTLEKNGYIEKGSRVSINGIGYPKTIFIHPPSHGDSYVRYEAPFDGDISGQVALNDSANPKGICTCCIAINNQTVWQTSLSKKEDVIAFLLSVKKGDQIELRHACPCIHECMHPVWIDPLIRKNGIKISPNISSHSLIEEYWGETAILKGKCEFVANGTFDCNHGKGNWKSDDGIVSLIWDDGRTSRLSKFPDETLQGDGINLCPIARKLEWIKQRHQIPIFLKNIGAKKICEVGVRNGDNFRVLLSGMPEIAVAVDMWRDTGFHGENDVGHSQIELDGMYDAMMNLSSRDKRIKVIRKPSIKAAEDFIDDYFDFVYIDADHSLAAVNKDIRAWYAKVRPGGFLAGHDFCDSSLPEELLGVKKAVTTFAKEIEADLYLDEETDWFLVK